MRDIVEKTPIYRIVAVLLAVLLVFSSSSFFINSKADTQNPSNPTVAITADTETAERGDTVNVDVSFKNLNSPVGGIGIYLMYDKDVFELVAEPVFSDDMSSFNSSCGTVEAGLIIFTLYTMGVNVNLTDCSIAEFDLKVKNTATYGSTDLEIDPLYLEVGYYDETNSAGFSAINCAMENEAVTIINPIKNITLNKETLALNKGDSSTLSVTYDPADTTDDKTVTWSSNNSSVASVGTDGKVTANSAGTANITATVGSFTKTCVVTVSVPLTGIELNKDATLIHKGNTETLTVTYNPTDTTDSKTVTWTSDNTSVATVDSNGKITAVNNGTATIKAQVGAFYDTCAVTVDIPLSSISLNKTSTNINKGNSETLTVSYNPNDTTDDRTVSWKSSNTSIAEVDSNGKITANAVGTATITATVGGKTASCVVSVKSPLTGISLNKTSGTLEKGEFDTLTVTYTPADTTDSKAVTWTSDDTSVAIVDTNGKVTAVGGGSTTIKATVGSFTKTYDVTVTVTLTSISLNKTTLTINKGNSETLTVSYNPADTTDDKTVTWTSANSAVASVDNVGKITANAVGTATITATVGAFSKTCTVTVKSPMTGISISDTSVTLNKGEEKTLSVTCVPDDTTDDKAVTWSSSNSAVASVDNAGKITANAVGTATITAQVGAFSKTCTVTVKSPMTGIEISDTTKALLKGQSATLTVTYQPVDTTDDKTVTWSSDDITVATVENGTVKALKEGTATITATVGAFSKTCVVTVTEIPLEGIALNKTDVSMKVYDTETLTIIPNPENTTDDLGVATWTSSDTTVAEVDENGKITAKKAGTATVSVTLNEKTASCNVVVSDVEINDFVFENGNDSIGDSGIKLTLGGTTKLNVSFAPDNYTVVPGEVTFVSDNPAVATVDEDGNIKAIKAGTAKITVSMGEIIKEVTVTVEESQINPPTSDNSNTTVWLVVALMSAAGLALCMVYGFKRRKYSR